ncbi:GNAT family N-acetyltransferase [Lachnospiraceae bacterium NSJ-143]|nr:GNAT family N-acetyltransferase [Lachnospiraceae bacterium NSJ-143]
MIRKIKPGDRDEYIKMAVDFYNSGAVIAPVGLKNIEATFDEMINSDRYVEGYFIEADGTVTGFGLLAKTFSQESGGLVVWIEELFIKPEYRSYGLGKEFFKFLDENFSSASRFRLETEPDNHRAIKLYKSLGFEPFEYIQFKKGQ